MAFSRSEFPFPAEQVFFFVAHAALALGGVCNHTALAVIIVVTSRRFCAVIISSRIVVPWGRWEDICDNSLSKKGAEGNFTSPRVELERKKCDK